MTDEPDLTQELNTILNGIRHQIRVFDEVIDKESIKGDRRFLADTDSSFGAILVELRNLAPIHINPRALKLFIDEVEMIRLYATELIREQEQPSSAALTTIYRIQLEGLREKNDSALGNGWRNRL